MINDCKKLCEQTANNILKEDWKHVDKNYLFLKAVEYENTDRKLFEGYVSAIVYRYWGNVVKNILRASTSYTPEDCYDWLINAALGTISYRPWTKPELKLYNDPVGPDKCMNAWLQSERQGYFQWSNCKKRSGYFSSTYSLEKMMDETGDYAMPHVDTLNDALDWMYIKSLVCKEFNTQNFVHAFVIDGICRADVMQSEQDSSGNTLTSFSKRKLVKHLKHMNNTYCESFSEFYDIDYKSVLNAKDICVSLSADRIYTIIRKTLEKLANSSYFKKYKCIKH